MTHDRTQTRSDWWDAAPPDQAVCNGCDDCGGRCLDGWECTLEEFEAILTHVERSPAALAVCAQPKAEEWGEGRLRLCWFRDRERGRCAVYPVRPLICRLFGHVEWLPCPTGAVVPAPGSGIPEVRRYARVARRTFAEWSQERDTRGRARRVLGSGLFAQLAETEAAPVTRNAGHGTGRSRREEEPDAAGS